MRRVKPPSEAVANMWKRTFMNETSKFIGSTYLTPEDYHRTFVHEGTEWKILGWLEGRNEIPCEKVENGEVYMWDKWKCSEAVRPERHAAALKGAERVTVPAPRKEKPKGNQLSLFDGE